MKKCPYCAEEIQDEAKICRFCGKHAQLEPPTNVLKAIGIGLVAGVIICAIILSSVLIYFHFSDKRPKKSSYSKKPISFYVKKPTVQKKLGFTEGERKRIFTDLWNAEGRADKEAMRLYSADVDLYLDKVDELEEEYRKRVRDRWNITKEQQRQIIIEGVGKRWDKGLEW